MNRFKITVGELEVLSFGTRHEAKDFTNEKLISYLRTIADVLEKPLDKPTPPTNTDSGLDLPTFIMMCG